MESVCINWVDLEDIRNLSNNGKNLSFVFGKLVKSCIFDKYNKIKLDTKNLHETKLSMFRNMLILYHLYVESINNIIKPKWSLSTSNMSKNQTNFIKTSDKNIDRQHKIKLQSGYYIDLSNIRSTLESKFKFEPSSLQFKKEIEQRKHSSKIKNDEETPVESNVVIPNKFAGVMASVKNGINKKLNSFKIMLFDKNKDFSIDISVFGYFLNQINNYLISRNLEGIKLDFVFEVACCFLFKDEKLFSELQDMKYKNVQEIISKIHQAGMTNFRLPYNIILNCILKSNEVERYTFEYLNNMLNEFAGPYAKNSKSANDNTIRMNKILLLQAFAYNTKKTITFSCMPNDFTDLLKTLIEVSGNSIFLKSNKKDSLASNLAAGVQSSMNCREYNIGEVKINFNDMLLKILDKIRTPTSKDKSCETNFYTQNWIYEVHNAGPVILEFMAHPSLPFDCLSVLLKKFTIRVTIDLKDNKKPRDNKDNDFNVEWINQIIDQLYTEFCRLEKDNSQSNQVVQLGRELNDDTKKSVKQRNLLKFVEPFKCFYGNFLYPIVSNKFYNKSNISVDAYNKLIKMTNSLMAYDLLGKNYEREFINAPAHEKLTNAQNINSNKIEEIKSKNRFDIYEINSRLINTEGMPLTFPGEACLTIDDVFSWYRYFKLNGANYISNRWLYHYFCQTKSKAMICDIDKVDFIIDIWNGQPINKQQNITIENNITATDFLHVKQLVFIYVGGLTAPLKENIFCSDTLQDGTQKFLDLVQAAMSLYFDNLTDGNAMDLCKKFIETFDPLLNYVSQNQNGFASKSLLNCKFYLTKAINEVERALLKKVLGKTNENVEKNLSLYDLYKQMIVFEEKRKLCAFNASDYSTNGKIAIDLRAKLENDFNEVAKLYLSKLPKKSQDKTKSPDNSKCIQKESIDKLVDQLYKENYQLIMDYHLSDGIHVQSAIESSLMVVDKFYRALPFSGLNLIEDYQKDLNIFFDSVTNNLFSVAKEQLKYSDSKEFKDILTHYCLRLVNGSNFDSILLSDRSQLTYRLQHGNDIAKAVSQIINEDCEIENKAVNLDDFNKNFNMLKNQEPNSTVNSIDQMSDRIAKYVIFRVEAPNKIKDEIKKLFKWIKETYQKNKVGNNLTLRLDDVFPIIQALFMDATISPDLIEIFTDTELFAVNSLSLDNLDKLAKIIRLKDEALINNFDKDNNQIPDNLNENDIVNMKPIENLWSMIEFDRFCYGKADDVASPIFTYLDLVSVVYGKKINYNDNVQGTFTASEINAIMTKGLNLYENWYELCRFIKYNWNGYGIVALPDDSQFITSNNNVGILEFLKALQCPAVKSIELHDNNYADKLKFSIESITKNIELFSKNKNSNDQKSNNGNKLDILDIVTTYIYNLNPIQLNDSQEKEIYDALETLLGKVYEYDYIQKVFPNADHKAGKLLDAKQLFQFLEKVNAVKGDINHWYPILKYIGRDQLKLKNKNPLATFNIFYSSWKINEQSNNLDQNVLKNWIYEYLNILPNGCLPPEDFKKLYELMTQHKIQLNKNQFIDFVKLSKHSLSSDDLALYLQNLLQQNTECFDDNNLEDIFNKIEGLDKNCINNTAKVLCSIRKYIQTNFSFSSEDGNPISFSIAKGIANADANKDLNDNLARTKYVLEQFNDKQLKIGTEDLEEIFKYYGLDNQKNQKLDIFGQNPNNLALLIQCVQVLSSDQFKLENIINNGKDKKDKNKGENNIDSCFNSPAMKFLEANFTHSKYGTLQMGYDAIIELISAALSGPNESNDETKQDLVLNLLCLFWTPVYDNKMLNINSLKNKINDNKEESWLNNPAFTKRVAVMYFVKHLYNLLLTIGQNTISSDEYKEISKSIQELQKQLSDYNNEPKNKNRKISKDDISNLYKDMIGEVESENKNNKNNGNKKNNESKSHLLKVNLQAKLFKDIKGGILDLITSDDDNNDKNKNPKIIISFAILHAINNVDDKDSNNYNLIFEEVIKSGAFGKDNKCDLETLKFVFDQMLCRGDGQDDTNRVSITFDAAGRDLFNTALGCLDDNSVQHSEIFDFLQDYFIPNGQQAGSRTEGWLKKFFSRLKNLFKKIIVGDALPNNNDGYLKPENFKPKKRKDQDLKENLSPDNNVTEKEFKLSKDNVINIMQKSNNHFLFYSNVRKEGEDKQRTDATNKFLEPYKNALSSETIIKYISKFRFQNLDSFEDFMKKYWTYDQLFCDRDLSIICANENFESAVESILIKFYVIRLMLMNELKNDGYDIEKNRDLLAYLARILQEMKNKNQEFDGNVSVSNMKKYCLEFCSLKKDYGKDENQEKIKKRKKRNREIKLLFGPKKEYGRYIYSFLISLLLAVIFFILIYTNFNSYLLIMFLIALVASGFLGKNLFDRKKFNDEHDVLQKLGEDFNPKEKGLYTLDLDLPPQDLVESQCHNANNNPPNMEQSQCRYY